MLHRRATKVQIIMILAATACNAGLPAAQRTSVSVRLIDWADAAGPIAKTKLLA